MIIYLTIRDVNYGEGEKYIRDLINEVRSGNKEAFREIYNLYKKKVHGIIYTLMKSNNNSEDIIQEVFLQVYLKLGQLRSIEMFDSWLYKITFNLCMKYLSKSKIQLLYDEYEINEYYTEDNIDLLENRVINEEFSTLVIEVIYELPEYHRMVIFLYYYYDMSIKEIANILEISEGTVKSRLFNSRAILKEKFQKLGLRGGNV